MACSRRGGAAMSGAREVKLAVDAVLPLVAERAGDLERDRRLPDDLVAALAATGLNRLTVPASLGGLQAPVTDGVDIVERLAAVDASTAWCAVIGFGTNLFSGYLPETGAGAVFHDPD